MHKENHFFDVKHSAGVVKSFAFDHYGQFLVTSDGVEIQVFYFRDFTTPVAVFKEAANFV